MTNSVVYHINIRGCESKNISSKIQTNSLFFYHPGKGKFNSCSQSLSNSCVKKTTFSLMKYSFKQKNSSFIMSATVGKVIIMPKINVNFAPCLCMSDWGMMNHLSEYRNSMEITVSLET